MSALRKSGYGVWAGFFCLAVFLHVCQPAQAAGLPVIQDIRFGDKGRITRLVIEADAPVSCSWFTLAGEKRRLVIDLPRVGWALDVRGRSSGGGRGLGAVSGYRYAHLNKGVSRLVLDLSEPVGVSNHFSLASGPQSSGHRVVFDLEPVSEERFVSGAGQPFILATEGFESQRPVIVIDPGHGGKDPGAQGVKGSLEKDINLLAALDLAKALRRTGRYRIELTRVDDSYLKLEERVEKARAFKADLFVSLHADAGGRAHVRGASVYTLSSGGARRAERMRLRRDWVLPVERNNSRPEEVKGILVDLVQSETKSQSARFAHKLMPALKEQGWPLLRRSHRNAGFFVLLAPDVPAVLLEMGFLTNAQDEKILNSEKLRRPLIDGAVQAIDDFFRERRLYLAGR